MKLFSTRVHGALDYLTVAALPTLPRLLHWDSRTCRFMDAAAAIVLAYSLVTDYEWGAVRLLPVPKHLAADACWGLLLCAAAPVAAPANNPAAKATLVGWGLFSLFASQTTESTPYRSVPTVK